MLLTILTLISTLLPAVLKGFGVSSSIDNLIPAMITALGQIITGIQTKTPVASSLTALQTALTALQADTSLSPVILGDISEGVNDLQAAIAAYQKAQIAIDPSSLQPLSEIV
jgi:hypothetical protein